MKFMLELFSAPWAYVLGWTLLHSLWQAFLIAMLIFTALRLIPSNLSRVRYALASGGLLLQVVSSLLTFDLISSTEDLTLTASHQISFAGSVREVAPISELNIVNSIIEVSQWIQQYSPVIVSFWLAGAMIFSLRIAGGWVYISRLKNDAINVDDSWSERIRALALKMNINKVVTLAESHRIQAPVVIGFIKPVILIPLGMLSGLTPDQIETIFIHELTHIRRYDYLINLIQSFIEALFFFNPFVWIISSAIRREREHCCDDAVLSYHDNALAYAYALTRLEEVRLSRSGLAMALAENKNQLLKRIKRIMEKSVKHYQGRERIIPVLLLVAGLICASWLSVNSESKNDVAGNLLQQKDTPVDTVKKKEKSARYSRKKVITTGEDGKPHEEIVEEFEGDEELRPLLANPDPENFNLDFEPPLADFEIPEFGNFEFPDIEPMLAPLADLENLQFMLDTIPNIHWKHSQDWEEFSSQFEEKFKEKFGDFYESHQKDFEKMMEELESQFENQAEFNDEAWTRKWNEEAQRSMELAQKQLKELEKFHQSNAWKEQEKAMRLMEEKMQAQQFHFREMEDKMKLWEEKMQVFEKDLKEELIKDGYIDKDEKISNMNWDDDGDIEINGKKIKDKDKQKYKDLHKKYFKGKSGNFRYVE